MFMRRVILLLGRKNRLHVRVAMGLTATVLAQTGQILPVKIRRICLNKYGIFNRVIVKILL